VTRVFLIAAPGLARERWEEELDEAGVSIVGRADDLETVDEEDADGAEIVLVGSSAGALEETIAELDEQRMIREMKVVLLSESVQAASVQRAISAGIRGILPAGMESGQLSSALEAVGHGLVVLHPSEVAAVRSTRVSTGGFAEAVEALTARERDVLQMLSQGLANKEIAARLKISEHTAKFHVASILGKLGASTRTEAVSIALRRGLILL
jgi:two-component system, NarL family, response regulator YdfI